MTPSESAFLAMGLILGIATGAALLEVLRARSPRAREVRVTVATDAVPRRRAATLADGAFVGGTTGAEPARGGPADRSGVIIERRTPVLDPRPGTTLEPVFRLTGPDTDATIRGAVPVSSGVDPMLTMLRATAEVGAVAATSSPGAMATAGASTGAAGAGATGPVTGTAGASTGAAGAGATGPVTGTAGASTGAAGPTPTGTAGVSAPTGDPAPTGNAASTRNPLPTGPCADARRLADERCELAGRARAQATAAESTHHSAQRAYDERQAVINAATTAADARAIRRAKDDAQARFRAGRLGARTTDKIEAAARAWLLEINAINAEAREAAAILAREQAVASTIAAHLERTGVEADAARIAAETAEAACVAARQAAAECEERASGEVPGHLPAKRSQEPDADKPGSGEELAAAIGAGRSPRIFRLLRGDRTAMYEMIVALASNDPDDRRRWQGHVSDLIDAILADSVAAAALRFPTEHPFWGTFNREQSRDIAAALSSLGYRFDGQGGWVDDRIPSQRDLSLALGYAGMDPMRMRHWPTEADMADLFADVQVAAAEHLASSAGDLTLGELVTMLGRRADGLADVWNGWGRIRPLLLEDA